MPSIERLVMMRKDTAQPIITDVNVEGFVYLTRDQIRYLKEMAKNGKISEKALSTIEEYIPGLLKENGQLSVREDQGVKKTVSTCPRQVVFASGQVGYQSYLSFGQVNLQKKIK